MATSMHAQSVLFTQFTTFYHEVIRLKQLVTSEMKATYAEQKEHENGEQLSAVTTVWQQLFAILEQQAQAPGPGPGSMVRRCIRTRSTSWPR